MDGLDPAGLADCTVVLGLEHRRAVREYWDQVIREEEVPAGQRVYCPPSLEELDERRARRRARRGLASVTRLARVRRPMSEWAAAGCGSTGPEAA